MRTLRWGVVLVLVVAVAGPASGSAAGGRALRYDGIGQGPDYSTDVAVSDRGMRVFVTGSTYAGPTSGDDVTTIAYDRSGSTRLWVTDFNGEGSSIDQASAIAVSENGRVYVTGYTWDGSDTQNDLLTLSYNAGTGEQQWAATYDGPGHQTDAGTSLVVAPDQSTVFVTGASAVGDGTLDVVTVAYDSLTGSARWTTRTGGIAGGYDEGMAVGVSPDGTRVFVAGYRSGATSIDILIAALDASTGDRLWAHTIDAGGDEVGRAVAVAPDGTAVFVTGSSSGASTGPSTGRVAPAACASGGRTIGADYVTAAYDPATGKRVWLRNYDGPDHDCDEASGLAVSPDSSAVFVTGSSFSATSDSDAATVAYETDDGATRWVTRYDGPAHSYDAGDDVTAAPDGSQVFVSGIATSAVTEFDFLTLFYDAASGAQMRIERYDGPGHAFDAPNAIAANPRGGAVYVTGGSTGSGGAPDYATVIYRT